MDPNILINLRKFLVPEIVYGPGALGLAGRHATNFGASKVLIVTDPGVIDAGWTAKVETSLTKAGIPFAVFADVTPNPRDHEVMAGAEFCHQQECDLILSVGGGSPMDCAKGIGVVVGNGGHVLDYEGVDAVPNPGPPLIFIPTTAGSSADVSQFAIVSDTGRKGKIAIVSKMVIPDISLVDPETTVTMAADLTAATGMDALCHAFEAFASNAASALTDMAALQAVRLVAGNLEGACRQPDNLSFRDNMMMASLMAGLAFSNASLGLVHSMAHSLGGAKDLAHGECNALLLEKVVAFNYAAAAGKYSQLAVAMGVPSEMATSDDGMAALVDRVATLRRNLGINQRLQEMGIALEDLPRLAEFAINDPCLATNPREVDTAQIAEIYKQIY